MIKNPVPQGKYIPAVKHGGFIFTAGMTPRRDGTLILVGKVEKDKPLDFYKEAVEQATKNALVAAKNTLAQDEALIQVMQLIVYVNAEPGFIDHTALADFASSYLANELGKAGIGPRAALGMAGLPNTFPAFKALHLPSVLHGVVGGAVMWAIIERLHLEKFVDLKTIKLLSGFFLELVVFTAMATLNLKFVSTYAAPLAIYSIVLTTLTVPLVLFCARKFAREEWFEKACMCFGAATGNTSTGLALVRSIDPNSESHAGDSHGIYSTISAWKDIFVGLTPLWLMSGLGFTAGVGAVVMVAFLAIGFIFFNTHRKLTR